MKKQSGKKFTKCYIAAPHWLSVANVIKILQSRSIAALNPLAFYATASEAGEVLVNTIKAADLVIAIFEENDFKPAFELGIAAALQKPAIVIAGSAMKANINARDFVWLDSTEYKAALSYAISQLEQRPAPKPERHNKNKTSTLRPLGSRAAKYIAQLENAHHESEVTNILYSALTYSGITVISSGTKEDKTADLALWNPEFEPLFGNPIIVEQKSMQSVFQPQWITRLADVDVRTKLLLVGRLPQNAPYPIEDPFLFVFETEQLLRALRNGTLLKILKAERNKRVHGGAL